MKLEFGEIKLFDQNAIMPSSGSYSLGDPVRWHRCREQFSKCFTPEIDGFYFGHPYDLSVSVASFIFKTEQILSLSNKIEKFSQFSLTNRPYAVWVQPSKFWKNCLVRRSLFTILLRCGIQYDPNINNYEAALKSDKYVVETQKAIYRFLFGYTLFNNSRKLSFSSYTGWKELFAAVDLNVMREQLVLPPEATVTKTLIGSGSIWN